MMFGYYYQKTTSVEKKNDAVAICTFFRSERGFSSRSCNFFLVGLVLLFLKKCAHLFLVRHSAGYLSNGPTAAGYENSV